MKYVFISIALYISCCSCNNGKSNREYEMKIAEVNKKEQELIKKEEQLMIKEKSLLMKEEELIKIKAQKDTVTNSDSSSTNINDTLVPLRNQITGRWNVNMRCIETDCTGSAVGDVKNEQWLITYHENKILAQAFSGDSLVREYAGTHTRNAIELSAGGTSSTTRMIVKIQDMQGNKMYGQREIIRPENCRILFTLDLEKL